MSYNLKPSYPSVDAFTTRDRGVSVLYGRVPDALGGDIVPVAVNATGQILIGSDITLDVSGLNNLTVLQSNPSLLNATVVGSGNFTVIQPLGANLHTVIDSGTIAATQSGPWNIGNIDNITGTISLPTGAATSALQLLGNTSLSIIAASIPPLGQAAMAASLPVVIASDQSPIPVTGAIIATPAVSTSAALTNVAGSASSVTLLAANANRKMAAIFNSSTTSSSTLYLAFAASASTSSYSVQIPAGGYYELPAPIYTGEISGIWSTTATAIAHITEFI
jgi:hypothetical protein